jgi:hypothetical protein
VTASIENLFDAIETAIEALTPPTRTEVPYRAVDGAELPEGGSADRSFWFEARSFNEEAELGAELCQMGSTFQIKMVLNLDPYGRRDQAKAAFREGILVRRCINNIPENEMGAGVLEAFVAGVDFEHQKNRVLATFTVSALTQETD